ncbi:hypothetical protein SVA_1262 [Sulfurifustis variabilis]|uniref:Uncharacterized protein n=1 Tax=Sulfurifustis variabilis TaxID=1675686 RepID=A0A1B4VDE5_9GAMM|nr:hypothetical protein [Sulfurifustis variabilis]BAU47837.1 hypothetical protein SVA_1262 [Sulfurifustis variabilis]
MNSAITWLQSAPPGAITLLTAIIGALVAVLVVVLTQWILGRRARTELLTSKLEELYLLLNQASSENVDRYEKLVVHLYRAPEETKPLPLDRSTYSLDLHKKIIMYVQLYFPHLKPTHVRMFQSNSAITDILYRAGTGEKPTESEIHAAFGSYGDYLRNMEDEIIQNRAILVKDAVLPRRYKVSDIHVPMPAQR